MNRGRNENTGLLLLSLLVAMVLQLLPLYGAMAMWRPDFVLLTLVFFLLFRPLHYGIVMAWLVGLALDVLYGEPFGRHALALGVAAYLLVLLRPRLLHAHLWYQCGIVLLVVAASHLIGMSLNMLVSSGSSGSWAAVWFPAISSALVWPLVYLLFMRWVQP